MIDLMLRAADRTTLETVLTTYGLMALDGGVLRAVSGISIAWDLPIILTPAVVSGDVVTTPPVLDSRCHINVQIATPASGSLIDGRTTTVDFVQNIWRTNGVPGAVQNRAEEAITYQGIEWIDPDTVATPTHRFASQFNPT